MSRLYEEKASQALEQLGLTTALSQLDQAGQQAAAEQWSYTHFLGYLLEAELDARYRKTVALNLQFAPLPYPNRLKTSTSRCSPPSIAASSKNCTPAAS